MQTLTETRYTSAANAICLNCGGAHPTQDCGEIRAALIDSRDDAHDLVAELRAELDQAHQHIGALTKELETAIEWIQERGTTAAKYAPTAKQIVPQLFAAAHAARAWLRRA